MGDVVSSEIKTVYEPGFGSMGELKEQVMIENPVGIYGLKEESKVQFRESFQAKALKGVEPDKLIIFAEPLKDDLMRKQALIALKYSSMELSKTGEVKMANLTASVDGDNVSMVYYPKVGIIDVIGEYNIVSNESDVKVPGAALLVYRGQGVSESDYHEALPKLISKANETLQVMNADFRIPQFPPEDKIKKI